MSELSASAKTRRKTETFTKKRLSKISEEIETDMTSENVENRPVDMTEVISEDKTDDITENLTEDRTEGQSEAETKARRVNMANNLIEEIAEDRSEGQTEGRTGVRADIITESTTAGGVVERVQDTITESTTLSNTVDESNRIESVQMNPFGKVGTSIIVFFIFAGIGSLLIIQIKSRAKIDLDDISKIFKLRALRVATLWRF